MRNFTNLYDKYDDSYVNYHGSTLKSPYFYLTYAFSIDIIHAYRLRSEASTFPPGKDCLRTGLWEGWKRREKIHGPTGLTPACAETTAHDYGIRYSRS